MFQCKECNKTFSSKEHLARHIKFIHNELELLCEFCGKIKNNLRNLKHHYLNAHQTKMSTPMKRTHSINNEANITTKRIKLSSDSNNVNTQNKKLIKCEICEKNVVKNYYYNHLKSNEHKDKTLKRYTDDLDIHITESAFKSRIIGYRVSDTSNHHITINSFINAIKHKVIQLLTNQMVLHGSCKINFELFASYIKYDVKNEGEYVSTIKSFKTKNIILNQGSDINSIFDEVEHILNTRSEDFQEKESGWALEKLLFLEINVNKYNPMRASSYIELPDNIKIKHAVINIQNNDEACFAWSVVAAIHSNVKHPLRVTSYPHYKTKLILDNISFPMSFNKISLFEDLNNISINVYGIENNEIVGPLYYTKYKRARHVNLLFIENSERNHFCWIKNLSRLVGSQLSKRNSTKWICDSCLIFFRNEDRLNIHTKYGCNKVKAILPSEGNNILQFKHYQHKLRMPFVIYCDFESILKPIESCTPNPKISFTENIVKHEPCSFAYYIKCSYSDKKSKFVTYRGSDCAKKFIDKLKYDLELIYNHMHENLEMNNLTPTELLNYNTAKQCHICLNNFDDPDNYKVRDHCHLTGNFRGAAHTKCNLNYKIPNCVPIVCHNLSGYDAHFIIKELGFDNEPIYLIAQNKERYISFTKLFKIDEYRKINLRFIDSFKFMPSSIDKLVNNLEDHQFIEVIKMFPNEKDFNLIRRKGVFPYDYLDSFEKFNDLCLPPKSKFFNRLNNNNISDNQYNHAKNVWDTFKCKNLGDYSDLYLKLDVLLLADIFENFRNVCMQTYDLDPAHYYTSPGLSWDAMLKYTKVKLELLRDMNMLQFIKKGVRGGLAQCSKRYDKANHKYMKNYNKETESKFLIYLDANNLYGWAMSQLLPLANFRWLTDEEINKFDIGCLSEKSNIGYILEVDLEYPSKLHELHNDFPFCVENIKPLYESSKQNKLIANLLSKRDYVIHQNNLNQSLEN